MAVQSQTSDQNLRTRLIDDARNEGFDIVKITTPDATPLAAHRLSEALEAGHHGDMAWMSDTAERRATPTALWPEVRSIIMLGMNYGPQSNPLDGLALKGTGLISVYAQHRDYHDLVKGKLKQVAGRLAAKTGAQVKVFVDTAPVMEKPLAQSAGLGWQGKHTNLVSKDFGSWLFLGSIFTDLDIAPDEPEPDHCGSCKSCLDICPTNAFPAPYKLDARRCISYLTIEHKGPIPVEFRQPIGNRIYGCDDCLAVCPWNKFAQTSSQAKLRARDDLKSPNLATLASLDDAAFRKLFSGSPVKRIGRNSFLRNTLIAIGNSDTPELVPDAKQHLSDQDPTVRGAAIWALRQLLDADTLVPIKQGHLAQEREDSVCSEW